MDVNLIRKINIARLVQQEGSQRKFAEKVGTDETYLSTLLSEHSKRNPGDELMRRIETVYRLAPGSLDFPDEKTQTANMKFLLLKEEDRQKSIDFTNFLYEQADDSAVEVSTKLAAYFETILRTIREREARAKKPTK